MGCRADPADVRAINGADLTDPFITPFITAANCIIDRVAATCPTLTNSCLKQAEVWLSAHMMAVTGVGQEAGAGSVKTERFENYSITWANNQGTGEGVLSTSYGQMANTLTNGCLVELDKRQATIGFFGGAGQSTRVNDV